MNKRQVQISQRSCCLHHWRACLGPYEPKLLMPWSSQSFKLLFEHNMGAKHESRPHWSKDNEISETRVSEGNGHKNWRIQDQLF